MANVVFKYRKGAGRDICGYPGTLQYIASKTRGVYNRANAMNPNTGVAKVPARHGGEFEVPLKNANYYIRTGIDSKRMARGSVVTGNFDSQRKEREQNILIKCLRG